MRTYYKPHRLWTWVLALLLACTTTWSMAQNRTISGTVSSDDGDPLIGVTVLVKGSTSRGTLTNEQGKFSIAAATGEALTFSYIGFSTGEVVINDQSQDLSVSLTPSASTLEEVVVVGYGRTKKSDLTGAITTVKGEDLTRIGTADVAQALQGRVAGVDITAQNGNPGAGVRIRIRGVGTINNSDPLYVVDGFQTGDISFLNPNDIASMEILKDASATAIYGSRGANGVVIINTKHGVAGKPKLEVSGYTGSQQVWKTLDLLDATQFATLRLEGFANDGINLSESSAEYNILNFVKNGGYKGTSWQDEVLRTGTIQNYSASLSGGDKKHRYNFTGTYFNDNGVVKGTSLEKFLLRVSNDYQLTNWLSAGVSAFYQHDNTTYYNGDYYSGILPLAARANPIREAWSYVDNNWGTTGLAEEGTNAARSLEENKNNRGNADKVLANIFAEATIVPGLTFRTQFGADLKYSNNKNFYPQFYISPEERRDQSNLNERRQQNLSWVWSNYMTFNKTFGKSDLSVMAGAEAQQRNYNSISVSAYDVPNTPDQWYLSAAKDVDFVVGSGQSDEALASVFGRINYSYDSRYLVTVNMRYDGSSRFLKENRWGFFPSFSLGWNLAKESFMANLDWLSELKLRGGWGQVGNQNSASNYGYVTTVTPNLQYVFGNTAIQGFTPTRLSNPELRWETTTMTNIGVDLGLLQDRISVTADYFIKTTTDMILQVPIPRYAGAEPPTVNAGSMENRGLELSANYRELSRPLKWEVGVNFTKITNQVVSLGGGAPIASGSVGKVGNTTLTDIGREIAYFYGKQTDGIFNTPEELAAYAKDGVAIQPNAKVGDVKFVDQNGDGTINDDDRVYLGSGTPDFTYGITASVSYKGFDLRIFFQGVQGNEIVNAMYGALNSSVGNENSLVSRLNRWTPTNTGSNLPRMTAKDPNQNTQFSDLFVEDGSYTRLKNLQLGYTFPTSMMSKLHMGALRVYVAGDNLLTFTKYSGWDPEIGELYYSPLYYGVDQANYPQNRRLRVGLDLKI